MFAKTVTNSAKFLMMPVSSRLLYYDLGMAADDDGIVEAFTVMRTTGASEDDLKVLATKEFIRILNEEFVTYITDWSQNNYIQKDRYHPSIYQGLLVQLNGSKNVCIQDVYRMYTEVREGEASQGKASSGKVRATAPLPEEDRESLILKGLPRDYIEERESRAIEYARQHNKSVCDVLEEWWKSDKGRYVPRENSTFDGNAFFEAAVRRSLGEGV